MESGSHLEYEFNLFISGIYTSTKWRVANDERKHYKVVMSYKKLTAVEKAGLKDLHRGERDKRICDRNDAPRSRATRYLKKFSCF